MTRRFTQLSRLLLALFVCALFASMAEAQEAAVDTGAEMRGGLVAIDWVLIAVYALSTIGLGWYMGRRQQTAKEYFVGRGNMNPALVGISLFATLLSTISYLAGPGEIIGKGPVALTSVLAYPFAYLIVGYLLIPAIMRRRVTSAYELLEERLGVGVRLLGASMFIFLRLIWMSLLVYAAAKAVTVMIDVDETWIPAIVLVTGFVSVIYTSLGGLRAVVITDLVQAILLLGGALLVVGVVTVELGGLSWFPSSWQVHWDSQPLYSFDPTTRVTVVGTVLSILLWHVCTLAGDQTSIQRFMATRDARSARRAVAINLIYGTVVAVVLAAVGLSMMGYFQQHPEQIPAGMELARDADKIFPRFIAFHLPVGISGLVVAAMFAAAMSSIDSGVNSITAVVTTDFLERFRVQPATERGRVWAARLLAFGIGALVVFGSSFMGEVPGNLMAVTTKTNGLLVTPIFGLFFFAFFVPFATPIGVIVGSICGTIVAGLIAFSGPIFGMVEVQSLDAQGVATVIELDPVSFQWLGVASLVANLVVGTAVSWVTRRSSKAEPR
jgi:SSS family solute:Na+ symporter